MKSVNRMTLVIGLIIFSTALIFSVSCSNTTSPAEPESTVPDSTPAPSEASDTVDIANFSFVAETVTISVGTTVTWTNKDSAQHTVTSEDGLFDSGRFSRNETFSYTFTEAGSYSYHCAIHPYMTGTIVVQ